MPPFRTSLIAAAALAGAAFITSSAQAITLSVEQAPTRVAAWDGTIVWSRLDPATGRYQLLKSVNGAQATPVAVAQRSGGPFDVDLGSGRDGSTTAVYSRDGDLYRLALGTGVEKKLDRISSPARIERNPTIQRGYIAFIRRDGGYDQLRIGRTTGASDGSRLIVKRPSIVSAELGDRHVAYVESVTFRYVGGQARVHLRNLRTNADRVVYKATSGGANFANVTRPAYIAAPEAFVWARTNLGSGRGNRLVRYTLRGSTLDYGPATVRYNSTSWAGGTLGAVFATSLTGEETPGACTDNQINYCHVGISGPLSFDLQP
jgi:hypothetical protein